MPIRKKNNFKGGLDLEYRLQKFWKMTLHFKDYALVCIWSGSVIKVRHGLVYNERKDRIVNTLFFDIAKKFSKSLCIHTTIEIISTISSQFHSHLAQEVCFS